MGDWTCGSTHSQTLRTAPVIGVRADVGGNHWIAGCGINCCSCNWCMCTFFVNVDSVYVTVVIEFVSFTRFMELLSDEFLLHAVHSFLGIIIHFDFLHVILFSHLLLCRNVFLKSRFFCLYTKLFFCMLTPFSYRAWFFFYTEEEL